MSLPTPWSPDGRKALARRLDDQAVHELSRPWYGDDVDVLVRTPWGSGPCSYVLVHGTTMPGLIGALLPASWLWLLPMMAVFIAVLIAVGPVVGRIRRLTVAVRRSAAQGFAGDVPAEGKDEVGELAEAFDAASRAVRSRTSPPCARPPSLARPPIR